MKLTIDIPEDMLGSKILDAIVYVDTARKEIKKVHIEPRMENAQRAKDRNESD